MWDLMDRWLILLSLLWSLWVIGRSLMKSKGLSCSSPCQKKIFSNGKGLVAIGSKRKAIVG